MKEFHYVWEWTLRSTPEELWPLVADTDRFDRDTGLPPLTPIEPETPLTNARVRNRFRMLGVPLEYEQEPFEWVYPYRFNVIRNYTRGVVDRLKITVGLDPLNGGTHLTYRTKVTPKNVLGFLTIPVWIGVYLRYRFSQTFQQFDQLVAKGQLFEDSSGAIQFAPGGRKRLVSYKEKLIERDADPELVALLVDALETIDDLVASRMRPYELADYWGQPRKKVLELFLLATRIGLLNFHWALLCPRCRVVKETVPTLAELKPSVHCETCNVDYDMNFERSVEITFTPNKAVRKVEFNEYCIGGPQNTPHIVAQHLLSGGDDVTLQPHLETGRYRLRTVDLSGGLHVQAVPGGDPAPVLKPQNGGWPPNEREIDPEASITFENSLSSEQLFILERTAWSDQATTGAEVIAMQRFRDLFSEEALRPGEEFSVGKVAIVFTDLRDSTRIYRQIGDAPAFGQVMDHFDFLKIVIDSEEGAVVKTIGDAVMAVFLRPASALCAMLNAQDEIAFESIGDVPLRLRVGIHFGPAIAVTQNERLDYFGSAVNIASRLEKFSTGEDIII